METFGSSITTGIFFVIISGFVLLVIEYRTGWFASITKSELSYEIVSSTPILAISKEIEGKITLLFNDEPVSDATSLVIRIANTGKVPITSSDFETDIEVETGASILQYKVIESQPDSLRPHIAAGFPQPPTNFDSPSRPTKIKISPLLLNQDDSFTVSLLLSSYNGNLRVNARITRIKEVQEIKNGKTSSREYIKYTIVAIIFLIAICLGLIGMLYDAGIIQQ